MSKLIASGVDQQFFFHQVDGRHFVSKQLLVTNMHILGNPRTNGILSVPINLDLGSETFLILSNAGEILMFNNIVEKDNFTYAIRDFLVKKHFLTRK